MRRQESQLTLDLADFCRLFGADSESFTEEQLKTITTKDRFRVSELDQPEAERPPMSLDLSQLRERLYQLGYHDDDAFHFALTSMEEQFPGCDDNV